MSPRRAYRHQLVLQAPVDVDDGGGGKERTWKTVAKPWGAVEPLIGREVLQSGQLQNQVPHRVYMRYRPDVTAINRFLFKGRTLEIVSVANIKEKNLELEIICQEVVGQ